MFEDVIFLYEVCYIATSDWFLHDFFDVFKDDTDCMCLLILFY